MKGPKIRGNRPMSAGELRELYGLSLLRLKSSEDVFRRETFQRDNRELNKVVQAIDAEKKHVSTFTLDCDSYKLYMSGCPIFTAYISICIGWILMKLVGSVES